MTTEQAIEIIKSNYPSNGFTMLCKALDMAIEALEQQQCYKEFFRDLFDEESTTNFRIIKE